MRKKIAFYGTIGRKKVSRSHRLWRCIFMQSCYRLSRHYIPFYVWFRDFSAAQCQCFLPGDKEKLLKIVEGVSGGVEAFEKKVHGLLSTFQSRKASRRGSIVVTLDDPDEPEFWPDASPPRRGPDWPRKTEPVRFPTVLGSSFSRLEAE